MKKYKIAVIGASGMVGRELLDLFEKRKFPVGDIEMFNSGKKPSRVKFRGKTYRCRKPDLKTLKRAEMVFFVSTNETARKYAPALSKAGVWCIDDSSEFRMDKNTPLVIPEINSALINRENRLIAGPNCTLTPLAVGCFGVHKKYGIEEVRLSTYQAVSGAGRTAIEQMFEELGYYLGKKRGRLKNRAFRHPIAFNLFPQVGDFGRDGVSGEEKKVELELKKIWNAPKIKISVTAVRVPVVRVHSLSAWIKTRKPWTFRELEKTITATGGVKYFAKPEDYSTPLNTQKTFEVTVSRLRKTGIKNEFQVWLCGDNLYKGAALNSVQIAEEIVKRRKAKDVKGEKHEKNSGHS